MIGTSMSLYSRWRSLLDLLMASSLALYFELLFIRWLPATIHILGYFTNLVLIAAFLGQGIGVARRTQRARIPLVALLALSLLVAMNLALQALSPDVTAPNLGYYINEIPDTLRLHLRLSLYPVIAGVFVVTTLAFVPLGQLVGQMLQPLPALPGYCINVLGALLGIAAFAILSALRCPPSVWVGLGVVAFAWFVRPLWASLIVGVLLALGVAHGDRAEAARANAHIIWSPYYKIHVRDIPPPVGGHIVQVNNNFLLCAFDLALRPTTPEFLRRQSAYYALPYAFIKPRSVLVLGAGAGNDCQMALLQGASDISAVEIDPVVAGLGRTLNPAHPLADPRVRVVVDDARSFLRRDRRQYDLIVFGTLDSHTLFSSMASVRMENFVYTLESFRSAAAHLTPSGVIAVCVGPMADWVHARIVHTLEEAVGRPGEVYYYTHFLRPDDTRNLGVVAGPGVAKRGDVSGWSHFDREAVGRQWRALGGSETSATDDWPNVFLKRRGLPVEYAIVLSLVLALGGAMVAVASGGGARQPELVLLGAGFMLLETRSITQMGLLFGATWVTSSLVISVVLIVILAATALSLRREYPRAFTYPALMASLVACWSLPASRLATGSLVPDIALSSLYVGLPILLAALVFADAYRRTTDIRAAFSSNLLGAVLGGLLEYTSLVWGMRAVYLIALLTYGMAMQCARSRAASARQEGIPHLLQ